MKKFLFLLCSAAIVWSCSERVSEPDAGYVTGDVADFGGGGGAGGGTGGGDDGDEQSHAGIVTAGEWRDLDNWAFWSGLMADSAETAKFSSYWGLFTNNRVAVRVTDENGAPQRDVAVQLVRLKDDNASSTVLYEARTDNKGEVNMWISLTQKQASVDTTQLRLIVDNTTREQPVAVTHFGDEVKWNACTASVTPSADIDIAFIVDATGSMLDEISFLKSDLTNIISQVSGKNTAANIRTAALFYRDEGDDYVTRVNDLSADVATTAAFIAKQNADGGGDYPEAVHTALETGLQKLSWREDNCIRLAFMLLDAPPHKNAEVIASLQKSIPRYAQRGIRIIPVAASGVDDATEFFLRFTALATDATYVFITNDSGVGGEHKQATVGEYKVELLNELIIRLINQYME